jgi:serine/threonine protein kinase
MKNYRLIEVVGDGTFGTVWKGIHLETGEKVAVKKLKKKIKTWYETTELKELKALQKLKSHQNIIKLKEIIRETNSDVFFVFEWADTNLYEFMCIAKKRGEYIPENQIKEIIYRVTSGLNYIHSNGFFHRDLKPENILLSSNGTNVKIADFGLAREVPNYYDSSLTDYVCTRWYRPPECVLKSTNYSSPMDVWALGCIMAELYTFNPIFAGNSEFDQLTKITNIIGNPKLNDWPEGFKLIQKLGMKFPSSSGIHLSSILPSCSIQGINLLYDLLKWDPLIRPDCSKILSHPYFDDVKERSNFLNSPKNSYYNSFNILQDEYLNNFNYNTYRNNNNLIPDLQKTNSNLNNNPIYNNEKSKFSTLAENDYKYSKLNYYKENSLNKVNYFPSSNINDIYGNKNEDNFGIGTRKYGGNVNSNNGLYYNNNLFNFPQIFI